jgi:hypothetical protein
MAAKIVYHPAAVDVTLTFVRGPVNFRPYWEMRGNDNLSSSGENRERVVEAKDILISFEMPHLVLNDDLELWGAFASFALDGGQFKFFPNTGMPDYYNCVSDDTQWGPTRNAPRKYGQSVKFRVLNDAQAPSGPHVILRRFYGIAG